MPTNKKPDEDLSLPLKILGGIGVGLAMFGKYSAGLLLAAIVTPFVYGAGLIAQVFEKGTRGEPETSNFDKQVDRAVNHLKKNGEPGEKMRVKDDKTGKELEISLGVDGVVTKRPIKADAAPQASPAPEKEDVSAAIPQNMKAVSDEHIAARKAEIDAQNAQIRAAKTAPARPIYDSVPPAPKEQYGILPKAAQPTPRKQHGTVPPRQDESTYSNAAPKSDKPSAPHSRTSGKSGSQGGNYSTMPDGVKKMQSAAAQKERSRGNERAVDQKKTGSPTYEPRKLR